MHNHHFHQYVNWIRLLSFMGGILSASGYWYDWDLRQTQAQICVNDDDCKYSACQKTGKTGFCRVDKIETSGFGRTSCVYRPSTEPASYKLYQSCPPGPCVAGKFKEVNFDGTWIYIHECKTCSVCPPGFATSQACTISANTVCTQCPPGTFSSGGASTTCQACNPGYYTSSAGLSSCSPCKQCPVGFFQPQWQCSTSVDTECTQCTSPATTSAVGQTSCNSCVKDHFWNTAAGACAYCGRVGSVVHCPPGTYAVCPGGGVIQTSAGCTACTGHSSSNICASGKQPNFVCDGGGLTNSECMNCPAGKEKTSSNAIWCTLCGTGYWKAASVGAGNCQPCTKAPVGAMYTSWVSANGDDRSTDSCPWYLEFYKFILFVCFDSFCAGLARLVTIEVDPRA